MKAIELMETLAKVIEKNPKAEVSFMVSDEDVKDFGFGTMEGTNFFEIETDIISEEDVVFISLKRNK